MTRVLRNQAFVSCSRWSSTTAMVFVLAGCGPVPIQKTDIPQLEQIRERYAQVVEQIRDHPDEDWYSGWIGNFYVNWRDGPARGLCYEWQERVYWGVRDAVHEVGWATTGIQMNRDTPHEHHAVLVFDPGLIRTEDLLSRSPPRPVYVLDPWKRGVADVYMFDEWVQGSGWSRVESVGLEDLDAEAAEKARESETPASPPEDASDSADPVAPDGSF